MTTKARIFISYKRNVEPDAPLAHALFDALSADHEVYLDEKIPIGTVWAQQIERQIREADFLIVLLSKYSVQSQMVVSEIKHAHHCASGHDGRPRILPIRVDMHAQLPYPLSAYLDHIQAAFWSSTQDTPGLLQQLRGAIHQGQFAGSEAAPAPVSAPAPASCVFSDAQPLSIKKFEAPEGTMAVESAFYIDRDSDVLALGALEEQGATITIKGARQMGKSSLLNRLVAKAGALGKRVAFLDFQLFERPALESADTFLRQFCFWLTDQLGIPDALDKHWTQALGPVACCTRYMERYVLPQLDAPAVFALDEVDAMLSTKFRSDFFGMLRSWHNQRAMSPVWRKLDLVLVVSTEPYQLISDLNQSPFNVGINVELGDFTAAQVAELDRRYGMPFSADQLVQLMSLVGGHPYLTRRALHLVATKKVGAARDILAHAADDQGPFGDHLRHHLFRLHNQADLVRGLLHIIKNQGRLDDVVFFRLSSAGLVKRVGRTIVPRCQIYAEYFASRLSDG